MAGLEEWPQADSPARVVPFGSEGLAPAPGSPPVLHHLSPQTLGAAAGEWCPYGQAADQPADQRQDDALALIFETAPLAEPLDVLGTPAAELEVSVDSPSAFLAVRRMDAAPDGAATASATAFLISPT